MTAEAHKLLWDARRAADRIARFVDGRTFVDYRDDDLLRSAVERQFEIVGEAFSALRRVAPDIAATIPDLPRIVAFRNVLIHAYAIVDDTLVWGVVETRLSGLRATLETLLADGPATGQDGA